MPVILLRFDCCADSGMGHFTRCRTLLRELQNDGETKVVCCCGDSELVRQLLSNSRATVEFRISGESELVFLRRCISKYKPSCLFIDLLRNFKRQEVEGLMRHARVVFFHNLSEGSKYADAVILPTAHAADSVKEEFEEVNADLYEGFEYFFPREQVKSVQTSRKMHSGLLGGVAISAGGTDPRRILEHLLALLTPNLPRIPITFYVGEGVSQDRFVALTKSASLLNNITVKRFSLEELARSAVVVSVFGVTSYELVYLNVPTVGLGLNVMNGEGCKRLADRYGVVHYAGNWWELTGEKLIESINELLQPEASARMKSAQYGKIDQHGLKRVVEVIRGL